MARKNKRTLLEDTDLILDNNSGFLMREDYKALRTNVTFSFADKESRVIAVTSASRGEGKSTTAINLAISFASLGEKVLLIDGDLRLPTVATKLGSNYGTNGTGFTDYLIGDAELKDTIKKNREHNIYVMYAGTLPPDPTRLLQSDKLAATLNALKQQFRYIIIDCPPVGAVIDAALISRSVDGYLLVVRHEHTDFKEINAMLNQLNRADAKILGFVYTNAPTENKKYYRKYGKGYYGSYYYYKKPDENN